MLWTKDSKYKEKPFELEKDLEAAIIEVQGDLFGPNRIYLDFKKRIGEKGKKQNIPDGYLIDLTSNSAPSLYVVENELAKHHPLKHIAVQLLEFSLSFETSKSSIKSFLKAGLKSSNEQLRKCEKYVSQSNFDNLDHLLDSIINKRDSFQALVIIDDLDGDLEKVLMHQFKFPVEILTLKRFTSDSAEIIYEFEPLLGELVQSNQNGLIISEAANGLDFADLDTVVVPAQEEGFKEVFLGENRWYKIRISSSMIPKIKYIAGYQVAPISAITHIAKVQCVEPWEDSGKYVLNFSEPAQEITPIKLPAGQKGQQIQSTRYTNYKRLINAKSFMEAF